MSYKQVVSEPNVQLRYRQHNIMIPNHGRFGIGESSLARSHLFHFAQEGEERFVEICLCQTLHTSQRDIVKCYIRMLL